MKIKIEVVPQKEIRFNDVGDYYYKHDGTLLIRVADTGNSIYTRIVLIHEIIEQLLTEAKGITIEEVDEFDRTADKELTSDSPQCPHSKEHSLATAVERILCAYLGIPWQTYDNFVSSL